MRSDASPASSTSIATRRPCCAASAHIRRTCSWASASVCSIHGMPPTTSAPRSTASRTSSSAPGSRSSPSCGNATTWRSTTPRNSSRSASSGITPSSRAGGVDVGEREHVAYAVPHRLEQRAAGVGLDPAPVVVGLDRRGQLDGVQRGAHLPRGVRRQRGVADPVQRVDLVEVHVPVDEALGDQRAGGVDLVAAGQGDSSIAADGRRRRCRSASGRTGRAASRRRRRDRGWARLDSTGARRGPATAHGADETPIRRQPLPVAG